MDRIRLDVARLHRAGDALNTVKSEFTSATGNANVLAEAVGDDALAQALVEFADTWDDRRADMVANLEVLAQTASGIAQAFGDLDREYAAALEGGRA